MARTQEQLLEVLKTTKQKYEEQFEEEYPFDAVKAHLEKMLADKIEVFVDKYYDHLPPYDLIEFIKLFNKDTQKLLKGPDASEEKPKQS